MKARSALALAVALVLVMAAPSGADVSPDGAAAESARRGAAYLSGTRGDDGSVPDGWRPDQVAEAMIAVQAGGGQAATVDGAVAFLGREADGGASTGPWTGRIVSGLVAVGENPRSFEGVDFVARLQSFYDPVTGTYGGENFYADTLAMAGVLAAGARLPDGAVTALRVNQCVGGGWSHQIGCAGNKPDTDTTAMAVSVLVATAGPGDADAREGRQWLLDTQHETGGWGHEPGKKVNSNSTGLAVSAASAFGEWAGSAPWTTGDRDPIGKLLGFQLSGGGFKFRADTSGPDDYATVQAVPGLAGWSYPVSAPEAPTSSSTTTTTTTRPSGGSTSTTAGPKAWKESAGPGGSVGSSTGPASVGGTEATTTSSPRFGPARARPWVLGEQVGAERDSLGAVGALPETGSLTVREVGDDGGVGVVGVAATGALASVGAGLGGVWRRRGGLGS